MCAHTHVYTFLLGIYLGVELLDHSFNSAKAFVPVTFPLGKFGLLQVLASIWYYLPFSLYYFWWVYGNIRFKCAFQWDGPFGYLLLQSGLSTSFAHFSVVFSPVVSHCFVGSSLYIVQYMYCQYFPFSVALVSMSLVISHVKALGLFIVLCKKIFYFLLAMLKSGLHLSSLLQRNSWDIGYEGWGRVSWSYWHIKVLAPVASHQNKNVYVHVFTMCHIVF